MLCKDLMLSCVLTALLSLSFHNSLACTRILVADADHPVMTGRNMDWGEDTKSNLMVYPRHMSRSGMPPDGDENGNWVSWESKYGSIVATGYEDLTCDGLNEAGLSAHILWYEDAEYEKPDPKRPGLSLTVWTQYYLDNFKTVEEAVRFTETHPFQVIPFFHPVTNEWGKLHLILDDATGDSAILEHQDGKLRIYHSRDYIAATNEPSYDKHLRNLKKYKGFGGKKPLPGKTDSLDRFVRATWFAKILPEAHSNRERMAGVLAILNNAAHPFTPGYRTYWHSVADLTNKIYYFQSVELQNLIQVNLDKFDLGGNAVMKLDMVNHPEYAGDVADKFEQIN